MALTSLRNCRGSYRHTDAYSPSRLYSEFSSNALRRIVASSTLSSCCYFVDANNANIASALTQLPNTLVSIKCACAAPLLCLLFQWRPFSSFFTFFLFYSSVFRCFVVTAVLSLFVCNFCYSAENSWLFASLICCCGQPLPKSNSNALLAHTIIRFIEKINTFGRSLDWN